MTRHVLRLSLIVAVAAAVLALAGCGSSEPGTSTFEEDAFDITFRYPDEMKPLDEATTAAEAGAQASETEGIGFNETDLIVVQRYDLQRKIAAKDLGLAKRELDKLISQLAPGAPEGMPTEANGLPALDYPGVELEEPEGATTRIVAVFDGDVEYLFNCQAKSKEHERDIAEACDDVLGSLESTR